MSRTYSPYITILQTYVNCVVINTNSFKSVTKFIITFVMTSFLSQRTLIIAATIIIWGSRKLFDIKNVPSYPKRLGTTATD